MCDPSDLRHLLPSAKLIRCAVTVFLDAAYPDGPPEGTDRFCPPDDADVAEWLMTDVSERSPDTVPADQVRSFALRIGNSIYPNMKLRISRPPCDSPAVFHVDAHDAMLNAPESSADYEAVQDLKRHNAALVETITAKWESCALPTERSFLRAAIAAARQANCPDQTDDRAGAGGPAVDGD
ncbi:MAG: hypothetical protein ACYS8X_06375 [Planctomycetota bacterium]|jgi:hypothetical protein